MGLEKEGRGGGSTEDVREVLGGDVLRLVVAAIDALEARVSALPPMLDGCFRRR